jgi:aerobic carbon-monoxide dehydrogenase medium subunit
MKPSAFEYSRPATVAEAVNLLANGADDGAMVICGGQSLLIMMALRITMTSLVVDVSRLEDLRKVERNRESTFIGAATTHAEIEDGKIPDPSFGLMPRVASKIAYRAVRNRGTIGGSIALADPSADWPACLIALDAEAVIAGPNGERREKIESFIQGAYQTGLDDGEIIVGFEIANRNDARWGTSKVSRKSGAFADSISVFIDASAAGPARLALTGTTSHARLLPKVSAYATQNPVVDAKQLRAVALEDLAEIDPAANPYQLRCHVATLSRAIAEARAK